MVDKPKPIIIWDREASTQLKKEYNQIKKESLQGAETVRDSILDSIDEIPDNPYRYPPDKLRKDNTGNYRAFEIYNYRVAYKVTEENILILRVRHVKREPLGY